MKAFPESSWSFQSFTFAPRSGCLRNGNAASILLPKDSLVLACLLEHAGSLVAKAELHAQCWPNMAVVGDDVLKTSIRRIRRALGDDHRNPTFIQTVGRRGYTWLLPAVRLRSGLANGQNSAAPPPLPLIGREREMEHLRRLCVTAQEGGFALVAVTGEAGVGKSVLVESFVAALAGQQALILQGAHVESLGPAEPYFGILETLRHLASELGRAELARIFRQVAPMWLAQLPWLVSPEELIRLQASFQGASSQRMQRELLALWHVLAERRPMVLVLEDMHWSDQATVELLSLLPRMRPQPQGLLLITTCRLHERLDHPFHRVRADLVLRGQCQELLLQPFNLDETAAFLCQRFQVEVAPAGLVAWLMQYTNGNPLFLKTLVGQGEQMGWLAGHENHLIWNEAMLHDDAVVAPTSLQQLVAHALDQLEPEERHCIETASVAGNTFFTNNLAEVPADEAQVESLCVRLVRTTGFLKPAGLLDLDAIGPAPSFAFVHALYHRLIYGQIPYLRRRSLHGIVGRRMEVLWQQRLSEVATTLASHFELAGHYDKAIHYRSMAGGVALSRCAYHEAMAQLEHGLSLLPCLADAAVREQAELSLLLPLGAAALAAKGYASPEVERVYGRAEQLLGRLQGDNRLDVLCGLGFYHLVKANFAKVAEYADLIGRESIPGAENMRFICQQLLLLLHGFYSGDLVSSQAAYTACRQRYASLAPGQRRLVGGIEPGIGATIEAAMVLGLRGYPDQAYHLAQEALTMAEQQPSMLMRIWSTAHNGWLRVFLQDYADFEQYVTRVRQLGRETGIEYWNTQSGIMLGWLEIIQHGSEDGLAQINQYLAMHRQIGGELVTSMFYYLLADAHRRLHQNEAAQIAIDEAIALSDRLGERWWLAEMHRLRGIILQESLRKSGDRDETAWAAIECCFLTAVRIAAEQQAKSLELRATISLAEYYRDQGKPDRGLALLKDIVSWFTEGFHTVDYLQAQVLLAELAADLPAAHSSMPAA